MTERPPFIRHYQELPSKRGSYEGDDELMSEGTLLSRALGLTRLGIWHEQLPPGTRTSWPHAEEKEEEFVFVLEGAPDAFIDGVLHRLAPGDCVAFAPGTGITHSILNNTDAPVRLLCIGEKLAGNRFFYAMHPNGYQGMKAEEHWHDAPRRALGPHDGLPDALRASKSKG